MNLTEVQLKFLHDGPVPARDITVSVYDSDDPDTLGASVYTDTFSTSTLTVDGTFNDKTFSMDVDVDNVMITVTPVAQSDVVFIGFDYVQLGVVLNEPDDRFTDYTDVAPYGSFIEAGSTVWAQLTIDGATVTPGTQNVGYTLISVNGANVSTTRVALHYGEVEPEKAITPFPTDAETDVVNNEPINLTWVDGGAGETNAATSYDVYFGTALTGPVFQETVATEVWAIPQNFHGLGTDYLNQSQDYEWRIDSVNDDGTTTGDTWTFQTSGTRGLGKAINPTPDDEAIDQSPTIESVTFQNGGGATKYDVYFGQTSGALTKVETITAIDADVFTEETFGAGKFAVAGGVNNYWRIDAVNNYGSVTGDEWYFTTTALAAPVQTAQNASATIRRLILAANNKLWYEDV